MKATTGSKRSKTHSRPQEPILQAQSLIALPWLIHGFSTRLPPDGSNSDFNLGFLEGSDGAEVERNRVVFARSLGAVSGRSAWRFVRVKQVHSDIVHSVREVPSALLTGDGLITSTPGIIVSVLTADCVPVLVVDRKQHVVGAFHAGWRGTLARIVEKGVGSMRRDFGSDPANVLAAIGPAIGGCCYEVSAELVDKFEARFPYGRELFREVANADSVRQRYPMMFMNMRAPGHGTPPSVPHLDLIEANCRQLIAAGVPKQNVEVIGLCTSCRNDLLFSHRKEHGETGRMMAAIGIKP